MSNLVAKEIDAQTLAFEVARNEVGMKLPMKELLANLGVPEATFLQHSQDRMFVRSVKSYKKELEDKGVSFQMKARIQAEEMLKKQWLIVHDPLTPPQVAVKAIENTVRWAGLDASKTVEASNGPGFSITINLPNAPSEKTVIESQP